jgi:hypothetical protein
MPKTKITFDTVREAARALPDVEFGTSWGSPALKVRGDMFACIAINKSAEPNSLAIRMDFAERDSLIAEQPDVYYLTDHYVDYPCVLVRLNRVHPDALRDLLTVGWRFVSARRKPRAKRTKRA